MNVLSDAINKTKAYYCYDCGKCTGNCPIVKKATDFSPRVMVGKALIGDDSIFKERELWSCLTCALCSSYCQSDVHFHDFVRMARVEARNIGLKGECAHSGSIQSMIKIMSSPHIKQNRLNWISRDISIAEKSDYLLWVGCAPYFDVFFDDLGLNLTGIAKSAVKILNKSGVKPVIMNEERCCGHDALWTGDVQLFKKLGGLNIKAVNKTKAKKVVFTCPECYLTFKESYTEYFGDLGFELVYITDLISDLIKKDKIKFKNMGGVVTYQDSCRLSRHLGMYDEPREIINTMGIDLVEMEHNKTRGLCCGTSSWINCDSFSKIMQDERLKEARDTKAEKLVTSCPKCQIHFLCAMDERNKNVKKIEIEDLTVLVEKAII